MHGYYYNTTMRFNRHWQGGGEESFFADKSFTNKINIRFEQITGEPWPATLGLDIAHHMPRLTSHRKPAYAYVTLSSTDASAGEIGMQSIAVIANTMTDAAAALKEGTVNQSWLYTCPSFTYTMDLIPDNIVWTKYFEDEKDYLPSLEQKIFKYGYPAWNGHTFIFDLSEMPDTADGYAYDIQVDAGFVASTPQKMTVKTRIQLK